MTTVVEETMWQPHPLLSPGALLDPTFDGATITADPVIICSGMGGNFPAHALAGSDLSTVIIERGRFLPRRPENFDKAEMYPQRKHQANGAPIALAAPTISTAAGSSRGRSSRAGRVEPSADDHLSSSPPPP